MSKPHPELQSILPQLKLNKRRILVPGCGYGHDAAYLAKQGHIVTAIDISEKAVTEAKRLYGHISNLDIHLADVFQLDETHREEYDVIFEHTCYCAISPTSRDKLIKVYKKYLSEKGHLLGIFFCGTQKIGTLFW